MARVGSERAGVGGVSILRTEAPPTPNPSPAASRGEGSRPVPAAPRTRKSFDMSLIEVVLGGVISGGLYALIAIGFNLQYGVARIFNLAYGEFLMAAAFAAFWMFTLFRSIRSSAWRCRCR